MKIVRLTALTTTAAVAAMAFVGASSASAVTHPWYASCRQPELVLCATANLVKHPLLGRRVIRPLAPIAFSGVLSEKCTEGNGKSSEFESQSEKPFEWKLEELIFSGCEPCTKAEAVKGVSVTEGMETDGGSDWTFKANNFALKFIGCPFGVSCKFEANLNLGIQMNEAESFFEPKGVEFKLTEGSAAFCGSTMKWTSGKTTFFRLLDDVGDTLHRIWPTLLANLTPAS